MVGIANAAAPAAGAGMAGGLTSFIPLILIFVVFYFLLIRPQQKQAKQHQAFLNSLKKGNKIVTKGGIYGVITSIDGDILNLEIAQGVEIKVTREAIGVAQAKPGEAESSKKEKKKLGGG